MTTLNPEGYFQRQFVRAVKANDLTFLRNEILKYPKGVVDLESSDGFEDDVTAIRYAIYTNRPKLVKLLLSTDEGIDITYDNNKALRTAVKHNYLTIVEILLNDWRIKTTLTKYSLTCLIDEARKKKNFECMDILFRFRFDYPKENHREYQASRRLQKTKKKT